MTVARFEMPDGRIARFEVPDGTTPEQAQSMMQDFIQAGPKAEKSSKSPNGADGQSFFENLAAGMGKGFTDIGLGAKQRLDEAAAYLEGKIGGQSINKALGMQNASDILKQTQGVVDEKRRLDAGLMETGGGQVGNFVGQAIPAAAAAMVPGGQGLAGSIATGGALGAATPTGADESVLANAAVGAAGGAAGFGIAKGVGRMLSKSEAAPSSLINAAAKEARDAGYVLPPTQTNPSLMNNLVEGASGKLQMRQQASLKNQNVTNKLAAKALGLPEDTPLTMDVLNGIRKQAGTAYAEIKQLGTFALDEQYDDALSAIAKKYTSAAKDFPGLAKDDIPAVMKAFKPVGDTFESSSAVDAIAVAREMADTAYASGNKALGGAYKSAAKSLEDLVERNLKTYNTAFPGNGYDELLGSFQESRRLIAKTYSVQKGMNVSTGDVNAAALGAQLQKGSPLSGELEQIAKTNKAFPFATKETTTSMPGVSPLDLAAGGLGTAASGSPLPMLLGPVRMAAREAALSKPYQMAFGSPDSGISGIANTAQNAVGNVVNELAPAAGNAGAVLTLQQRQAETMARVRAFEEQARIRKAQSIGRIGAARNIDEALQAAGDAISD